MRLIFAALATTIMLGAGCKPRSTDSASSVKGDVARADAPRATLYHYGTYGELTRNRNGISANDWTRYIVAKYQKYRAGLYVAQHPAYNERYAGSVNGMDSDNAWLMSVDLKEECLRPDVAVANFQFLPKDERFKRYIGNQMQYFQSQCLAVWDGKQFPGDHYCAQVMANFITAARIKVIYDQAWPNEGYWVILDRDCIENVHVSPEEVLKIFATVHEFWNLAPFTTLESRREAGIRAFYILMRAVAESTALDQATMDGVASIASKSDMSSPWRPADVVPAFVGKAKSCATGQAFATLKASLSSFLSNAPSSQADFIAQAETFVERPWECAGVVATSAGTNVPTAAVSAPKPAKRASQGAQANSCEYARDGACDDGRKGSTSSLCKRGTDEADCFKISSCTTAENQVCEDGRKGAPRASCAHGTDEGDCAPINSCEYALDGACDDGRPGSGSSLCRKGTDEADCFALNSCATALDKRCDDGRKGAYSSTCRRNTDEGDCKTINSCEYALDGACDDGRRGSTSSLCKRGTDEGDCKGT